MDSEWRLLTSPTQEKYSSRKATIVPPSPSPGCTSGQFRLKLALFYDTGLLLFDQTNTSFGKSISEMFIVFNLNKLDKKLLCNIHVSSSKRAKLPIFALLRFSECVPQFIPSLCRENIRSFSKWWQLSRRYKSCESCPGDRAKKVKHLSSPPILG